VNRPTADLARQAAPAIRLRPDFTPTAVLSRNDKALLVQGTCAGTPAVAKLSTATDPYWRAKAVHEIEVYRAFDASPPPVRTPRLLAADPDAGVLLIEQMAGDPLSTDRYPARLADRADLDAILQIPVRLSAWQPPTTAFAPGYDYPARLDKLHEGGLLGLDEHTLLLRLLERAGPRQVFAHADPLPANFLGQGADWTLIDFEHAGLYLPGYDLAVLWVLLRNIPQARAHIETVRAQGTAADAAFWLNTVLVVLREIRIHREVPDTFPWRAPRLTALESDWDALRTRLPVAAGRH